MSAPAPLKGLRKKIDADRSVFIAPFPGSDGSFAVRFTSGERHTDILLSAEALDALEAARRGDGEPDEVPRRGKEWRVVWQFVHAADLEIARRAAEAAEAPSP